MENDDLWVVYGPGDFGDAERVWDAFVSEEEAEACIARNSGGSDDDSFYIKKYYGSRISSEDLFEEVTTSMKKGKYELSIRGDFVKLVAFILTESFKAAGGKNYVALDIESEELGPMVMTMQRRQGKTPAQVNGDLRECMKEIQKTIIKMKDDFVDGKGVVDSVDINRIRMAAFRNGDFRMDDEN